MLALLFEILIMSTENEHQELAGFVKGHYLFNPLQDIVRRLKWEGVFEDPIPKMFAQCSRSCAHVFDEDLIEEAIDIDDVFLLEDAAKLNSKKQPFKSVVLPQDISGQIQSLQNSMLLLTEEMAAVRPLLEYEKSSRLQALKFPTRMIAVVLKKQEKFKMKAADAKSKRKRRSLPGHTLQLMKNWLFTNAQNPYPSPEEKRMFAESGNLEIRQIDYWFTNARARLLRDNNPHKLK